ncbi:MAG TPA: LuxR C-terminal-related transcriptional regulator [Ktedonobacterales bacterium]|nr:LuxR C-terminal-related transcriptional regulator [Ktedonobacterales bacterium]
MIARLPEQLSNLPAPISSFIGRGAELEEIMRLLRRYRLVTLTGSGGVGKTRLALRAAERSAEGSHFPDGVWLAELAPLSRPELIVETVAKVAAAREDSEQPPLERLAVALSQKRLLLALDNCEHLLDECAHLAAYLLARCPELTLLATSREPLAINGEAVLRVAPLSLPAATSALDLERQDAQEWLLTFDAVRLFCERARAAEPSFRLSRATASAVVEICQRLDGIPLALELAAMRVRGMGVAYLGARLDDRFRLLTAGAHAAEPRQQTLTATVEWSYGLLTERERTTLRRLGVFVGDFSPEAAEAVCAASDAAQTASQDAAQTASRDAVGENSAGENFLDDLARLVDKSLVQFGQATGRYRLLETIRLFCVHQLEAAGETQDAQRQHFLYYLQLVEDGAALLGGPDQEGWFNRIEQEHDNHRAALGWALGVGRTDEAARLALGLWRFWRARTYQREGLRWLEQILALDATYPAPEALRPRLLLALGVLAHAAGAFDRATIFHTEALRLWEAAGDERGQAQALFELGWQRFDEMKLPEARRLARDSLLVAERTGDDRAIADGLLLTAVVAIELEQLDGVIPTLARSLAIWQRLGDVDRIAVTEAALAGAYQRGGDYERSKPLLAESLRLILRTGSYGNLISTLVGLLRLALRAADHPDAAHDLARVIGAMRAWEERTSLGRSPWWDSPDGRAARETIDRIIGPEARAQYIAQGWRLTDDALLALTERLTDPTAPATPTARDRQDRPEDNPHARLTRREREVLRLVAQGMTNAQVARELIVTPRTVNAHLTAIYGKLGVTSRSRAIRYALDHHLG